MLKRIKRIGKIFNKQTIIAFLLGAFLFNLNPIYAAIEEYVLYKVDYNIVVNNSIYENTEYPILNYKGTTYVPLKVMSDILNIPTTWNAEFRQVEITTNTTKNEVQSLTIETIVTPTPTLIPIKDIEYEENGLTIREIGEEKYVEINDVRVKLENTNYILDYFAGSTYCTLYKKDSKSNSKQINVYNQMFSKDRKIFNNNIVYIKYIDYINIISLIGDY
ncbi:MAG: stalk domain-containing protein [Tissierellia bacterium]|nr:stalk domain-containing protein [Tissierellia bacterium]